MTSDYKASDAGSGDPASATSNPELSSEPAQQASIAQERQAAGLSKVVLGGLIVVVATFVLFGAFGAGVFFERHTQASDANTDTGPEVFAEAWNVVEKDYVDESAIDESAMLESAIDGMLVPLGDEGHTRYLTPEEVALDEQNSSGTYVGVGIQVVQGDAGLAVVRAFPNAPAQEAGVQSGDVITAVDNESVVDLPQDEIINRIRGPEGSSVSITFHRPSTNEDLTFDLTRQQIEISAVSWTMLDGDIALLRLEQFQARSADDLANALKGAQDAGAKGIILDLRNNPGGFVSQAMQIASMFIPSDATVFIRQTRDGGQEAQKAIPTDVHIAEGMPLVVLVNHGTASASEIVSGAIQAAKSGQIIGEQTIGTGTVLHKYTLEDGSALWLGEELWLTPEGKMIRESGITPDINVSLAEGQTQFTPAPDGDHHAPALDQINDSQIDYAVDQLTSQFAGAGDFDVGQLLPAAA